MSGYVFSFNGGAISWWAKKQGVVALSSTEVGWRDDSAVAFPGVCVWCVCVVVHLESLRNESRKAVEDSFMR